jgi:uncharacterized membrane protein YccC
MKKYLLYLSIALQGLSVFYFTRVILMLVTFPHSAVVWSIVDWWHIPVAIVIACLIVSIVFYLKRNYSHAILIVSVIMFVSSNLLWKLVFNIHFMNNLIQGFWVK